MPILLNTEIAEKFIAATLPGNEWKVVWTLINYRICTTREIMDATHLSKRNTYRALKSLQESRIIERVPQTSPHKYWLNKNTAQWGVNSDTHPTYIPVGYISNNNTYGGKGDKNDTSTKNLGKVYWSMWKQFCERYFQTHHQHYPQSTRGKIEINMMKNIYHRFSNEELWHGESKTQADHCRKIIDVFFEYGRQRKWILSPRALLQKVDRCQLLLTKGDDGVWRPQGKVDEDVDTTLIKKAMATIHHNRTANTVVKQLENLPERLHHKLQDAMTRRYTNGMRTYEQAYKKYLAVKEAK